MPRKPKHPCSFPGCPNLTERRYCQDHEKEARRNYDRYQRSPNVNKVYGRTWRKVRDRYAKKHPLCEQCLLEGRYTPVQEVHHIIPIKKGGTHSIDNLMSLCRSCHNKKHIELGDR